MRTDTIYNKEYWIKKGYTEKDAVEKVIICKKETSWRCKEFWIKRGYTDDESKIEIGKKQSEISFKRDRNKKLPNVYSINHYVTKGITNITEIKQLIIIAKEKSNPYLKWSESELKEVIKKRKETYYEKSNEERDKINKSRGLNKEQTIEKFGVEKAFKIFEKRGRASKSKFVRKGSKISKELFDLLSSKHTEKKFLYGDNEKYIFTNGTQKGYFIDFICEDEKKVIEFNGDFWHFNPKKYLDESFTILKNNKIYAKDVWKYDETKIKTLTDMGFKILIVWESDYLKNKTEILSMCNDFINK